MSPTYRFPRPSVTVDVALFGAVDSELFVLLIQRGQAPFAGSWALPGGFLDMDEELETAARRELLEETGIDAGPLEEIGTFGEIGRDPRGRTLTVAYAGLCIADLPEVSGQDDASDARWWHCARLPKLAFDHRKVIRRARARLLELVELEGTLTRLLPRTVDTKTLANVHTAMLDEEVDGGALRRKLRKRGVLVPHDRKRDRVRKPRRT